jgi:hypothetical protein
MKDKQKMNWVIFFNGKFNSLKSNINKSRNHKITMRFENNHTWCRIVVAPYNIRHQVFLFSTMKR